MSWIPQAEAAIRSIRGVDSVTIVADGDEIRELHVVSSSERLPKYVVRDVQSVLQTQFRRSIDHRVVSVAFVKPPGNANGGALPAAPVATTPLNGAKHGPGPALGGVDLTPREATEPGRIRFSSVNLLVVGPRAQAQVELRWKGVSRIGNASGSSSRDGSHALVARATLAAIQQYLEDVPLEVNDVQLLHVGRKDVVVTALTMVAHRQEKTLVGCCTVEQDVQQAVVLATLAGLNRVVGGLKAKESVEYVLRPTSFRGA